jgi:pimeloyl-ACP methyl ester carboxylesterase
MYQQANHLALTRQVILQDTRGEGRSPFKNFTTFHYDDFTRDAIALLDHLKIPKVAVVGWSDGAITGIDLAMNYSSRIERVFAHGANIQANMSLPGLDDPIINSESGGLSSDEASNGTTYSTSGNFTRRAAATPDPYACENISPTPKKCKAMEDGVALLVSPTFLPICFAQSELIQLKSACGRSNLPGAPLRWPLSNAPCGW